MPVKGFTVSIVVTTLVLSNYHHQVYLIIYVMYVCIIGYYCIINNNIIVFMLRHSIFAPLGELKMSVLKMRQSRQLCQEQTATSKCLQMDPRRSDLLQHTAHPLTRLLCHHPTQSSLTQSLTKGATWEISWSRGSFEVENSGPHLADSCLSQKWKGNALAIFGTGIWAEGH